MICAAQQLRSSLFNITFFENFIGGGASGKKWWPVIPAIAIILAAIFYRENSQPDILKKYLDRTAVNLQRQNTKCFFVGDFILPAVQGLQNRGLDVNTEISTLEISIGKFFAKKYAAKFDAIPQKKHREYPANDPRYIPDGANCYPWDSFGFFNSSLHEFVEKHLTGYAKKHSARHL